MNNSSHRPTAPAHRVPGPVGAADPGTGPAPARVPVGRLAEALAGDSLPSLADILEHYRRHGTVAATAVAWPAASAAAADPFDEPILGLQTRELEGPELFEQFFGPGPAAQG